MRYISANNNNTISIKSILKKNKKYAQFPFKKKLLKPSNISLPPSLPHRFTFKPLHRSNGGRSCRNSRRRRRDLHPLHHSALLQERRLQIRRHLRRRLPPHRQNHHRLIPRRRKRRRRTSNRPSSFSTNRKNRFFKGESSNSKRGADDINYDAVLRLSFTCEICTDEKPVSDSFRIIGCDHRYCTECISNYVAAKLQDNITRINCPVPGCGGFLEPPHCRTILPKAVFERWGDALCEALILGAEKYYCPYKDCSALLIDDDGNNKSLTQSECPECRRLFCVSCKAAWHSGIMCSEFQKLRKDERSNEDIMLMNLAKSNNWIRCPKCRFYVSKSDGCLYMKCRCGYSFCYNCGAQMNAYLHYCTKCKH